jgi:hypothetical protein
MKKSIIFLTILLITIFYSQIVKSQCQEYIEAVAEWELDPYILDGNFQARIIYEGDSIQVSRTFLAGNKYKISIIGMDMFAKNITITDDDGFIVFKNYLIGDEDPEYFLTSTGESVSNIGINFWEFEPEYSQNLKITVEVEKIAKKQKLRLQGCLGVVVGFETE